MLIVYTECFLFVIGMVSKSVGQILRISVAMHILFQEKPPSSTVSQPAIKTAIDFVETCYQHAAYIVGCRDITEVVLVETGTFTNVEFCAHYYALLYLLLLHLKCKKKVAMSQSSRKTKRKLQGTSPPKSKAKGGKTSEADRLICKELILESDDHCI